MFGQLVVYTFVREDELERVLAFEDASFTSGTAHGPGSELQPQIPPPSGSLGDH